MALAKVTANWKKKNEKLLSTLMKFDLRPKLALKRCTYCMLNDLNAGNWKCDE